MSTQLSFHNTTVQSINRNNQTWISSADLAKLLEYSDSKSVTKIYSRNSDEFTSKMTMVVKMTTNGINNSLREKSVRIFSLRGAHLISMFANTNVAKEVRKWLLDLADKEIGISETISLEQQQMIKRAVQARSYRTGEHYQAIYTKLYEEFKIPRYQDLPALKFEEAIKFLGGVAQVKDNYEVLVKQLNHLEIIHDSQQKLLRIYLNDFQDFLEKISPATNYNISVLLNKIQVNIGCALNYASTVHPTRIVTTQKQLPF